MPRCIICGEKYFYRYYWEAAEDCSCGRNLNSFDARDEGYDAQAIQDMKDEWRELQQEDE